MIALSPENRLIRQLFLITPRIVFGEVRHSIRLMTLLRCMCKNCRSYEQKIIKKSNGQTDGQTDIPKTVSPLERKD